MNRSHKSTSDWERIFYYTFWKKAPAEKAMDTSSVSLSSFFKSAVRHKNLQLELLDASPPPPFLSFYMHIYGLLQLLRLLSARILFPINLWCFAEQIKYPWTIPLFSQSFHWFISASENWPFSSSQLTYHDWCHVLSAHSKCNWIKVTGTKATPNF